MTKTHRHAGLGLELITSVPPERAIEIVQMAAECQQDIAVADHDEEDTGKTIQLVLLDMMVKPQMLFSVTVDTLDDKTRVTTAIEEHGTSQWMFEFFIPVSRKSITGLRAYKRFMSGLGQVFTAADPSARFQVVDTQRSQS